ncbi:sensor histidine kinase [Nocardioides bizhenqiangii]|uniref:Oxygen sensor histidine kinase NreB n=1 Tax=Nocardioides bizhenqiangii TaxID=3095076 RepID=A0ABZ0ZU87_9ACTN|nr:MULTISPECIES: GAF domain-containing sensor histidine kinase [unclassified Nocardioides]MDZ5621944.1 GAF domain-containing sensor histidine kinase [Nocardioides sp. HM23]WQQ27374.1 GAF domain-containing sensor histidine kinase [Nocardioides sp. HM61]
MLQEQGSRSPAAAIAVPVACSVLFALAVVLDAAAPETGAGVRYAGDPGWPFALNGVILGFLAAPILLGREARIFGWLLGLLGLFWVLDGLAQSYIRAGITDDRLWPGMTFSVWFLERFGVFLPISIMVLLLVFPNGRFLPGAAGVIGRTALVVSVSCGLVILVMPLEQELAANMRMLPPEINVDPVTINSLAGSEDTLRPVVLGILLAAFATALALVVVRYLRSEGISRDRMRWLAWSVVVIAAYEAVTAFVVEVEGTDYASIIVAMVLPGAAMTVAVVRPQLVPIEDLLGRTLVLAVLLLVLIGADAALLTVLTLVLDDDLTQAQVVAVVLIVAVVLYGPLRQRLSAAVRRRMLGERGNRYDALAGLSSTLENTDDAGEQLAAVARAVAAAFRVRFVSLEVDRSNGERMVTTHGERPADVRTLPITYRGSDVGRLVLPAKGIRSRLTARDEELLGDLVRQAATAVRTSQLAEEVQHSRERLVTAREEERRRIRRDLHDGLGPALSGMVFQLEAARLQVDTDPDRARSQIEDVSQHVQGVVADVRRLVHDLRPPALDDRGLSGAIQQQADRLDVPLTVVAPELDGRLPAAVEVAAYRIASEALTNVARHARASRAMLTLALVDDALVVEVADDGVGIDHDRQAGVGLVSVRERAAELGGRADVTCPEGGGTVVRARLPLRPTPRSSSPPPGGPTSEVNRELLSSGEQLRGDPGRSAS